MEKLYDVTITIRETLEKTVKVKAKTTQEASEMVLEDYYSEKIVLTYEDYTDGFEIYVNEVKDTNEEEEE